MVPPQVPVSMGCIRISRFWLVAILTELMFGERCLDYLGGKPKW
jgi:hypothetical protein